MSLDMRGHIDRTFKYPGRARRFPVTETYVAGVPTRTIGTAVTHDVTIQAASDRERDTLAQGGERVKDVRRVYINDGKTQSVNPADLWRFDGINGEFRVLMMDNRPWRNYCKLLVGLRDEKMESPA